MGRFKAMRRPLTIAWAMVLASALGAGAAHAQPSSQPAAGSPNAGARADDLFKAGMSDVKQQKWVEAEAKFLAAFSLNRSYDIAANLGQTQYRLGKYREAAEHLAFAVKSWPIVGKKEPREAAVKRLEELRKLVARVTIRVNVPGAMVLVDGKEMGQAPLADEVFVDPGPRTIEVKLAGYKDAKQAVEAAAGSSREVALTMIAEVPQADRTPKPEARTGALGEGAPNKDTEIEPSEGGPHKGLIIAGIATSVIAIGAGIGFAVASNAKADDAEQQRAALIVKGASTCLTPIPAVECDEIESSLAAEGTFANLSVVSFIVGGAVGAGTAIYALTAPKSKSGKAVRAVPVVTASSGGLVITGRW